MGRQSLGEFELMVLLAVLQLDPDDSHTLGIVEAIRERTDRKVQRAAVYITLQRLEKKGLVSSWLGDSRPERGGKRRRLVQLQPAGVAAVSETRMALECMWRGLEPDLGAK